MVTFKIVIGTKEGKCLQKEIPEPDSKNLLGKKVGDVIKGELFGMTGYEFEITGGSDYAGFPMRKDIPGIARKKILAVKCIGLKKKAKGVRHRKTVCGNTIHPNTSQINLKILKEGKEKLVIPVAEKKEKTKEKAPKEETKK